jgi:beta-galactosidase
MDWYNQWHHVAGTWDGSAMKLYVDGVQVPELSHSGPYSDSGRDNLIGAISYTSILWYFDGLIDEARI